MMTSHKSKRRRICIIGGGAAGMACTWSLGRHPDRYDVQVWEALDATGGVASTCLLETMNKTSVEINDQVQGGAPSYRNNLLLFRQVGIEPHEVDFTIAFGTGQHKWSNHGAPSQLVTRVKKDIKRFGKALKWIHRLEFIFAFVPIDRVLKLWGFSEEFQTRMVFPLVALFFGTGNQTPHVSSAVIARVFLDPQLRLFEYCEKRLLNEVPRMFAFPKLDDAYTKLAAASGALVRKNHPAHRVERLKNGIVRVYNEENYEEFDDVVFACGAEVALRLLGNGASFLERKLLGNVTYYNDLIVTHEDEEYMAKHYEFVRTEASDDAHTPADMYFVRCDPQEPKIIEMSFNLTAYQPHLQNLSAKPLYQTIFLDEALQHTWTVNEIDSKAILKQRMTRQFAHTWKHFAYWVLFVRWLQGGRKHKNTWFAGAYTLFNTHEIAVMSGFAVADRLGAPYPFYGQDELALMQYKMYFRMAHGLFVRRTKTQT